MNDRPEFDPEKIYDFHRSKWHQEPKYFINDLEFLEQKIEAKLDEIKEQLSAIFQISTKLLRDVMDHEISIDNNSQRIEMLNLDLNAMIVKIKDLQDKANNE